MADEERERELQALLRAARLRVLHILGLVAVVMTFITLEIVVGAASSMTLRDVPKLVFWFVGCGVFALLGMLWYKARVKATQRLRGAVRAGESIRNVVVTGFSIDHLVPFGHEVDMDVTGADGIARHLALGFWTRESAGRLLALLQSNAMERPSAPREALRR